ncbi:MAG: hypothetical protein J6T16_04020 [Opitutales bacterium]|nr:hypothetical protein [Opitutales bacterium]
MDGTENAPAESAQSRAEEFSSHLNRLKKARKLAGNAAKKSAAGATAAEEAIGAAWEFLFDFFCRTDAGELELSDLNTISGVIHKLVSSESGAKANSKKDAENSAKKGGITGEKLRQIEQKLKLL